METHIDSYSETRVFLATNNGELMLALPIYANHAGAILESDDVKKIAGVELSIGMYDHIGYVAFHPTMGEVVLSKESLGLGYIEDLGPLR